MSRIIPRNLYPNNFNRLCSLKIWSVYDSEIHAIIIPYEINLRGYKNIYKDNQQQKIYHKIENYKNIPSLSTIRKLYTLFKLISYCHFWKYRVYCHVANSLCTTSSTICWPHISTCDFAHFRWKTKTRSSKLALFSKNGVTVTKASSFTCNCVQPTVEPFVSWFLKW